jgi:hypothetical protein
LISFYFNQGLLSSKLALQGLYQLEEIQFWFVGGKLIQEEPSFTFDVLRQQVGPEQATSTAVLVHLQDHHEIQPQENQVHKIIFGERFTFQMGVDASQAAEPTAVATGGSKFRNEYGAVVAHNHPLDFAPTINQYAKLSIGFK